MNSNDGTSWAESLGHLSACAPLLPGSVPSSARQCATGACASCSSSSHPALSPLGHSCCLATVPRGCRCCAELCALRRSTLFLFPCQDGHVTAAASLNCDPMVSLIAEVLYLGKQISKEEAE